MTGPSARIYDVRIRHVRRQRVDRSFTHRSTQWLVDLEDLPRLPRALRPFARFRSEDHLDGGSGDLAGAVRERLAAEGIETDGRLLMLANARAGGHVFNPLTVYWCHRADGTLAAVVAEVHNTYRGRHVYVLRPDGAGRAETDKLFYVSPFLTVDGRYRMALPEPGERVGLAVTLIQDDSPVFVATVSGTGRPATTGVVLRSILRDPFPSLRVAALIRWHGIRLWLRGLPVVPRIARTSGNVRPGLDEVRPVGVSGAAS